MGPGNPKRARIDNSRLESSPSVSTESIYVQAEIGHLSEISAKPSLISFAIRDLTKTVKERNLRLS